MASPCVLASPGAATTSSSSGPVASPTWTYRTGLVQVRRQVLPTSTYKADPTTVKTTITPAPTNRVVTTVQSPASQSQGESWWTQQSQPLQPQTARRLVSAPSEPISSSSAAATTSGVFPAALQNIAAKSTNSATLTTRATVPMMSAAASAPARSGEGPAAAPPQSQQARQTVHHCIASPTSALTTTLFCPVVWTPSQGLIGSQTSPVQAPATPTLGDRTCNHSLVCDSPDVSGLGPEVMDAEMSVMDKSVTSVPVVTVAAGYGGRESIPVVPPLPPDNMGTMATAPAVMEAEAAAAASPGHGLSGNSQGSADHSPEAKMSVSGGAVQSPRDRAGSLAEATEEQPTPATTHPIDEDEEFAKGANASTVEFEASHESSFWEGQLLGCNSSLLHFQEVPDESSCSEAETYLESAAQRWRLWNVQKHGDSIGGTCSFEPLPSDILCFVAQLLMEADKAKESKAETDWRLEAEGLQRLCERLAEDLSQVHKAHSESVADALDSCRSRDALANELRDAQILSLTLKQENARLTELLAATASPASPSSASASQRRTLLQQQQPSRTRTRTPPTVMETQTPRQAATSSFRRPSNHNHATATASTVTAIGSSSNANTNNNNNNNNNNSNNVRSSRPNSRASSVGERLFAGSTASSRQRALETTATTNTRGSSRSTSVDTNDRLGQRSNSINRRTITYMAAAASTPRQRQRTDLSSPRRAPSPTTPPGGRVHPRMNLTEAISQWKRKELERSAEVQHLASRRRAVPSPGHPAPSLASSDSASAVIWTPAQDRPSRGSSEATIRIGHKNSSGDVRQVASHH
mmetsp:Transcript_81509/g.179248  ORF Transcript_81509/g.179248 Transcript_81509/m.179248 type:complete len:811 (-) Transcript_81509:238-2670(-)|eukprot:CAMPEP_0206428466 /NCGR_PEP_ID=MMETSP0324_2-20121206/5683_1 /ASSEMBLY_ACC=CAM_ASM_000836 /TAXON_ID=2866 /ORGANISM="Crypthecodinium cohnii, Strain Seligo" /LENGTH=810 /DNA_ID=CAMNT_0053894003 /DNA_START=51 /DNA_END=2483 /DNA_ORIENTATION=+